MKLSAGNQITGKAADVKIGITTAYSKVDIGGQAATRRDERRHDRH